MFDHGLFSRTAENAVRLLNVETRVVYRRRSGTRVTLGERARRAEKRGRVRDPSHLEMFGSRVSESKHRKQQPSASTSGGLLEVETIAADGDARGGGARWRPPSRERRERRAAEVHFDVQGPSGPRGARGVVPRHPRGGEHRVHARAPVRGGGAETAVQQNAVLAVNELMKMAFSVAMEAKRYARARGTVSRRGGTRSSGRNPGAARALRRSRATRRAWRCRRWSTWR